MTEKADNLSHNCPLSFLFIHEYTAKQNHKKEVNMSCLERFLWTKLPRSVVPACKGILSHWAHLAARAAFRKGIASYCGHRNPVEAGTWAGGIVGLKSILGVKKREQALDILRQLSDLGYLSFELDTKTKLS